MQEAVVSILDRQHPANKGLPLTSTASDQWMNWDPNPVGQVHTIAQVAGAHLRPGAERQRRRSTRSPGAATTTAAGPSTPAWAAPRRATPATRSSAATCSARSSGRPASCAATARRPSRPTTSIERLTTTNQSGQLDQIGEPHGLTIAPDGKVFYIGKAACPSGPIPDWDDPKVGLGCGTIHQWDPKTRQVKLLTTLAVMGNRGSGDELVKNEEGLRRHHPRPELRGERLDLRLLDAARVDRPRAAVSASGRSRGSPTTRPRRRSTRAPARTCCSGTTQIHSCCHAGGGMAFDDDGNLYIGTGDSNSSGGSSGYSGNNWTQEYKGISFQDARRTAGNTNDLNGKILRIHPEAGRHVHDPGGQPLHRPGGGRRQDPPGDLRDGRTQHRADRLRPGERLAHRRRGSARTPGRRARSWGRRSTRPRPSSPPPATTAGRTAWATGSRTATAATPTPRC